MQATRRRRVNFTYDSAYWQTLADVSAYLEESELTLGEDFSWMDGGHTLQIDQDAYWNIKEEPEWQELLEAYEKVGDLSVVRLL